MVILLRDVSQRFASRWALARLTLAIPAGAAVLLTGENGAGKTTLLRLMATALKPTRGSLELFGQEARQHAPAIRRRLALMTHQNYLYDELSAAENLALVARLTERSAAIIPDLLQRVGLAAHSEAAVGTFSAGMKRRLALARVLLCEPELVLLDEPFGQLDPAGVQLMADTITAWRRAGATLVISTHDIERGRSLCTHAVHLTGGRAPAGLEELT